MNTYFIKRFIARTAVVLSAAALFCGCSDDDETSTLHFDKPEVVIGPESSTASFILRSDTSWKLHSDADWFTLNLTKGAKSASVIITYSENTSMTEKRTAVITATTLSGDAQRLVHPFANARRVVYPSRNRSPADFRHGSTPRNRR